MPDLEVPWGHPYGDIFQVQTPNLDRVTQQFQQLAQDRKAYAQKEGLQQEELLNKEMANVRSVDMPLVSDAYTKWKSAAQPLLFNKRLQNNPQEYNKAQIQANALLGNLRSQINKSAQLSQFGKGLATDRTTPGKSNLYADDFGDKQAAFWNTPMDQIQNHKLGDLSNPDTYRYKGMNSVDFGKLEKTAAGTPSQKYQSEQQVSPLQKNITPYTFGNTPAQFQEAYRGQLAANPTNYRAASAAWEAIPQAEKDRVDQAFSQIPKEKWEQMGLSGPQAIAPINPSDPADQLAAHKAKLYAINNNPAAGKVYSNIDQNAKLGAQFGEREKMAGINHVNRMAEIAQRFANTKDVALYKHKMNDLEGTTPTVDGIQTLLENPGTVVNGKTAVQSVQSVLSTWNSQGNTANTQSKLTALPSFTDPNLSSVKGFNDFHSSALKSVGAAYNALKDKEGNWSDIMNTISNSQVPTQQKAEILAKAYNQINIANGSPVRFTADDLKKSVPVLHEINDVFKEGPVKKYQVVKTGTPEFENVINEKRNAFLSSKKPVIQSQTGGGESESEETKIETLSKKYHF